MGEVLCRFENTFELAGVQAKEGYWFTCSSEEGVPHLAPIVRDTVISWFTEPPDGGGLSRSDLMPSVSRFLLGRAWSFITELAEIESELYSAIVSLPASRDVTPLPSIVSKEVEIHGAYGGRGSFNRIHTSFHPVDAVDPDDSRRCVDWYQRNLVDCYAFLYDLVNSVEATWREGLVFHHAFCQVVLVHSARGPSNQVLSYSYEPASYLSMSNPRWGTMRRRGAEVAH